MMVPPFAQAVAKLEKGKYSDLPVQTPFRLARHPAGRHPRGDAAVPG
jgi:hypothetical protein